MTSHGLANEDPIVAARRDSSREFRFFPRGVQVVRPLAEIESGLVPVMAVSRGTEVIARHLDAQLQTMLDFARRGLGRWPGGDVDHAGGEPAFRAERFFWRDDGIWLRVNWTDHGWRCV